MLFNLITLPVEFGASRRANLVLGQRGFIQAGSEGATVSHGLNAAGWNYLTAFGTRLAEGHQKPAPANRTAPVAKGGQS